MLEQRTHKYSYEFMLTMETNIFAGSGMRSLSNAKSIKNRSLVGMVCPDYDYGHMKDDYAQLER